MQKEPAQEGQEAQEAPATPDGPVELHPAPPNDVERVEHLAAAHSAILREVKKRIVGQDEVIDLLLVALFARGHGLFVGVPGLAKTLLITTLGEVLSLSSNRIQFTPDLMPSDITGTDVLEIDPTTGERRFRFVRGPVFTNILLADEINRTPPKTQAALLQAMAEGRVTAGGRTYPLEAPYLVFATQNPIEQEGTYPLPEAQLDRFLFQIDVGYPSAAEEVEIVQRTTAPAQETPSAVLGREEILALQELVPRVPAANHVIEHAVAIARASRPDQESKSTRSAPKLVRDYVAFGAGPRASQALILGAKARAVLDGRFAAEVEDVRALAAPVLRHRLVINFRAEAERVASKDIIAAILEAVRP
ncbi:MAG: AAA family ATPase [Deltaproteobacteria bacterium]|nr:MAG: AAA family ATPase [Deltaproteobacteria bacterium]